MKIRYVGLKDRETAFQSETGIVWLPGAEHDIKDTIASRMVLHPDVFEDAAKPAKMVSLDEAERVAAELDTVRLELATQREANERAAAENKATADKLEADRQDLQRQKGEAAIATTIDPALLAAFQASGMTVEDWNAMDAEARADLVLADDDKPLALTVTDEQGVTHNLSDMELDALQALAKANGIKVAPTAKADTVRARIAGSWPYPPGQASERYQAKG